MYVHFFDAWLPVDIFLFALYAVLCSMGEGHSAPIINFSRPTLSLKSFGQGISHWMEVNINKDNNCRYNSATFIVW